MNLVQIVQQLPSQRVPNSHAHVFAQIPGRAESSAARYRQGNYVVLVAEVKQLAVVGGLVDNANSCTERSEVHFE